MSFESADGPVATEAAVASSRCAGARQATVALVNMPFAMVDRPSIQCGLLKASLVAAGHSATVYYLNLELAAELGPAIYQPLSRLRANIMLGEWLFAPAAFRTGASDEAYAALQPRLKAFCVEAGIGYDELWRIRTTVLPDWIEECVRRVDWSEYTFVGFTSTFEQNNAAFAMARSIKAIAPTVPIVFGGANFDGEMGMEYLRALPFIDYAVVGEGDQVVVKIADRILESGDAFGIQGVIGRRDGAVVGDVPAPVITDMDALPDPDYTEYFAALTSLGIRTVYGSDYPPLILIESSRGCWWGQKHHCTFCGLNANGMAYRSKSAENALAQMRRLAQRYQLSRFEAVDNILDYRYLEQLCSPIARDRIDLQLFYEVKANLKRDQLGAMARAGIRQIQPGIESLNSHILSLMRKGTTMLQNVRCLKWATYFGMEVYWNILTGFPGESVADYQDQERVLSLLRHLQPPKMCGRIWLERFSPYFFDKSFPIRDIRPLAAYETVYPKELIDIEKIAYFFDYDMSDTVPEVHLTELNRLVRQWQKAWRRPTKPDLVYHRAPDWVRIVDSRGDDTRSFAFDRLPAAVYEAITDTERTVDQICETIAAKENETVGSSAIKDYLDAFCEQGFALSESGRYFGLALPVNRNW